MSKGQFKTYDWVSDLVADLRHPLGVWLEQAYKFGKTGDDAEKLSKMLFEAREYLCMYQETVQTMIHRRDPDLHNLIRSIEDYRMDRGWSPDGYGGEDEIREAK